MVQRVFIIHGWDFNPKMNWYPWLAKKLKAEGFKVEVPEMPNTSEPKIGEWVSHLRKVVGTLDEDTYFVGHSIGCQTIMRYLQEIDSKAGGAVFVAGWFKLDNLEDEEVEDIATLWMEEPIKLDKVKENISKLTVILSDNDPYNFLKENTDIFREKIGAKVLLESGKGHFTEDDGVKELNIALDELLKIAR